MRLYLLFQLFSDVAGIFYRSIADIPRVKFLDLNWLTGSLSLAKLKHFLLFYIVLNNDGKCRHFSLAGVLLFEDVVALQGVRLVGLNLKSSVDAFGYQD